MHSKILLRTLVLILTLGFGATASFRSAQAQVDGIWSGGGGTDGSWSNAANWGGTLPSAGDTTTLTFNSTTGTTVLNQDLGNPFVLNALTFNRVAPTVSYNITGNSLQFSGNNATILFTGVGGSSSTITDTIGTDIIIGGDNLTIISTSTSRNTIRITGDITTTNTGLTTITLGGSQTAANTITGVISDGTGTIALNKTEAGLWYLTGNNSFSGDITIQNGFLRFNSLNALGSGSAVTFGNLSNSSGILSYTAAAAAIDFARTINLSGTGAGIISNDVSTVTVTMAITGSVVPVDAGDKTLALGGANLGLNDFQTLLSNVGTTQIGLLKTGAGTWIVSNTGNNFTGGVTIAAGQLRADDITTQLNFNASGNNLKFNAITGTVAVLEMSGTLTADIGTGAGQIQWLGAGASGGFSALGGTLDVTLNNDATTPLNWNTTTTVGGFITRTGELQFNSPLSDNIVTLHNAINLSGANRTIRVTDNLTSGNDRAVIGGTISGGGINKVGTGVLELTAANTFSGDITINGGSLRVADVNLNLNLLNNNLRFNNSTGSTSGVLETFGSLTNAIGLGDGQLQWTLTGNGGFSAFGGALNVTLSNDADTPLVFGGTTGFLASGKELLLSFTSANDVVTLANSLDLAGANQTVRVLDNPFETGDFAVLSGTLMNGGLTKQGTGTLVISGNNTFDGGVTLAQGTLIVGSNSALGTGPLTLISGSVLESNLDLTSGASVTFTGASVTFTGTGSLAFAGAENNYVYVSTTLTNFMNGVTFSNETMLGANLTTTIGNTVSFAGGLSVTGGNRVVTVNNIGGGINVGNLNLAADGSAHTTTFSVVGNRTLTINGVIDDGGAGSALTLTAATGAVVTLNGANTFTGSGILAGSGHYVFGNDNALGSASWVTLNTPIIEADDTARSLTGNLTILGNLVLAGTETLALGGSITISGANRQISNSNSTTANVLNGTIVLGDDASARTLTLVGTAGNTLIINSTMTDGAVAGGSVYYGVSGFVVTGSNTYSGNTTIASGIVTVAHDRAFGSSNLTFSTGILVIDTTRTLANNVNLGGAVTFTGEGTLSFTGPGTNLVSASTTITNYVDALTFSNETILNNNLTVTLGNTVFFPGGIGVTGADRTVLAYNVGGMSIGDVDLAADASPHGLLLRPNTAISLTVDGIISDGGTGGNLTLSGGVGSFITLNGASTYSGVTTLQGSGNIVFGNNAALGASVVNVVSTPLLQAAEMPRTLTNDFNLLGNFVMAGTTTLELGGTITVSGGNRQISNSNSTTANVLSGSIVLGDDASARTLTLVGTAGNTLLVNSTITDGAVAGGAVYYGVSGFVVTGSNTYSGNTTIASGIITVGHDHAFGSSIVTLSTGTLVIDTTRVLANNVNLGGAITFSGDGTLAFNGTGPNSILASTTLSNFLTSLTFSNDFLLLNTLALSGSAPIEIAGAITVSGGNRQISNTNTDVVRLGAIVLGDDASARTLTLGGNALTSTGFVNGVVSDGVVPGGSIGVASGYWVMANANTYTGTTSLTGGILALDNAGALGGSLLAVTGGTLQAGPSGPVTVTNDVVLLGTLTLSGSNALTLTGAVTTSAARTINSFGTAENVINNLVGAPTPTTFAFTFGGTGDVIVNSITPQSTTQISVVISNSSGGNVIFPNDMSYTGTSAVSTTISAGARLQLGVGGTSGNIAGNIANSGTVIFDRSDVLTFTSVILGAGGVVVDGSTTGGVFLQNAQTFTGSLNINSGILRYGDNNAVPITNNVLVNNTGTLDLNGFSGGITTISDGSVGGGYITNGTSTGVLLTLTQGYFSGTISGGSNLSVQKGNLSTGVLTLSGNNDFSGTSTLAGGTLFVGTNSALGSGTWYLMGGAFGGTGGPRSLANDFTLGGAVTITTGADLTFNGVVSLSTPALTFTNANANQTTTFGSVVLRTGTAASATTTINFADGVTTVFGDVISQGTGTRALVTFTGQTGGTGAVVTLLAANTYTGITTVGGNITLSLAGDNRLASNMTFTLTGNAIMALGGDQTLTGLLGTANTIVTNSSGGDVVLTLSSGNYAGIIQDGSGSVSLSLRSTAGTLTLANDNTYTGTTSVFKGILALGSGGSTGAVAGDIVLSGTGAVVWNRNNAVVYAGNITATSGAGTGTGGITFTGGGSFDMQGTNQWIGNTGVGGNTTLTLSATTILGTGAITIANAGAATDGGVLHILAGAQIGTGAISLSSGSILDFNGTQGTSVAQSSAVTLTNASVLMGSGTFFAGNVTANNASDIVIGTQGTVSTLTLRSLILAGGNLNFDLGATTDLLRISTTASVTAPSAINLNVLSGFVGAGTYDLITGLTGPMAGTNFLSIVGANAFIRTLQFNGNDLQLVLSDAVTKTWSGNVSNIWDTATTQNFTDSNSNPAVYNNGETVRFVDTGINTGITLSNNGSPLFPNAIVVDNSTATTYTFSGNAVGDGIGGATGIDKRGTGLLVLLSDNTFTGAINVSGGGTLQIGNGGTVGSITPTLEIGLDDNSTLIFNRSDAISQSGGISGSGNLVKRGSGDLTIWGINSYTGLTTIELGTLQTMSLGDLASANDYNIIGGTLGINGSVNQILKSTVTVSTGGTINVVSASLTTSTLIVNGGTINISKTLTAPVAQILGGGVVNVNNTTGFVPTTIALQNGTININVDSTMSTLTNLGGGGPGSQAIVNIADGTTLTIAASITFTNVGDPLGAVIAGLGTLSFGNASRVLTVNDSAAVDDDLTITATIQAGANGIAKTGAGTLYLTGQNLSSGANSLYQGTLKIGGDGVLGTGILTITGTSLSVTAATLSADGSARTLTNNINMAGSFAVTGSQNLHLTGDAVLIGTNRRIDVNNTGGSLLTLDSVVLSNSTSTAFILVAGGSGNMAVNSISDTAGATVFGSLIVTGDTGMSLTLSNANNYGGTTSVRSGSVFVGNAGALGTTSAAVIMGTNGGTTVVNAGLYTLGVLTFTRDFTIRNSTGVGSTIVLGGATSDSSGFTGDIVTGFQGGLTLSAAASGTVNFSGIISQNTTTAGGINKDGAGVVILSGNNTFTGTTLITAGTLQFTSSTALNSNTIRIDTAGTLDLRGIDFAIPTLTDGPNGGGYITSLTPAVLSVSDGVFSGTIAGGTNVSLNKVGVGTLVLTGVSTYAGGTTVQAGALQIGNGGASGSIIGNIANEGVVSFNRSDAITFSNAISGGGGLTQVGSGTLFITANQSYSGNTTVSQGTLVVNAALPNSPVTVAGGTLSGTGALGGSVTLQSGGTLNPGNGVGTIQIASLILNGGTLRFDLGAIGAGTSDQIQITGGFAPTVPASTTFNFNPLGGFGAGTYELLYGYTGLLTDTDFGFLTAPSPVGGYGFELQNHNGHLDVVVTALGSLNLVWTGSNSSVWNTTDGNWNGAAAFSSGNSVTFDNTTSTNNITVAASGVMPGPMAVNNDDTHTYLFSGGAINSTDMLAKDGIGTLIFANDVSFAGGATVAAGILQIGNGGTAGSFAGNIANSGVVAFSRSDTLAFNNVISGTGAVSILSGTIILSNDNTYHGATTVAGGILQLQGANASSTIDVAGILQFNTATTQAFNGVIAGTGYLQKLGSGTTTLGGVNTFAGITSVDAGTLVLSNALGGTIYVNSGGSLLGDGASASHLVVQGGSGTVSGTQSGSTDVSSGTITLASGGHLTGPLNLSGGNFIVQSGGVTSGAVSATGGLLSIQSGGQVDTAAGITINGGTVDANVGGQITGNGAINIGAGGVLVADGTVGSGSVTINVNSGGTLQGGHYDYNTPANSFTGHVNGSVVVNNGGTLSMGGSVGQLTIDGSAAPNNTALTLNSGANIDFEFRNVTGTTPGTDWDLVDLGTSALVISANNQSPANQIVVHIDSWKFDNSGHGGGAIDGTNYNGFDASPAAGWSNYQTYDWLFMRVSLSNITVSDPYAGSISGRFLVIDDAAGMGVFDTTNGNPFTRPLNQFGQGTFKVIEGNFGQGEGLYIHYSAIPEPSSMILAGLASFSAGWYGRKRLKKKSEVKPELPRRKP